MFNWILKRRNYYAVLREILSSNENRDTLLGVQRPRPIPSYEEQLRDVQRLINYSNSYDYSIFVKEVWGHVLFAMDKLAMGNTPKHEIDFHRGRLYEALELLRLSARARDREPDLARKVQASAHSNGGIKN